MNENRVHSIHPADEAVQTACSPREMKKTLEILSETLENLIVVYLAVY